MEKEYGIVIKSENDRVLVEAGENTSCDSCGARHSCILGSSEKKRQLWMDNILNAHVSDKVAFYIKAKNIVFASVLLYLLPVILLMSGMIGGIFVSRYVSLESDLSGGIGGFAGIVLYLVILKLFSHFLSNRKTFYPEMLEIVKNKHE